MVLGSITICKTRNINHSIHSVISKNMKNKLSFFSLGDILSRILCYTITVPGTGCDSGKTFLSEPHCAGCCLCVDLSHLSENKHSIFLSKMSSGGRDTFRVISYFRTGPSSLSPFVPPRQWVKLSYLSSTQAATGHYARYYYTWRFLLTKPTGWATAGAPTHLSVCVHACMCVWVGTGWSQWGGVKWCLHIWHVSGLALLFPRCVKVTKRDYG